MMNNNKILTVSYGTFSCTLEGFEDSFGTMKAIAEYFRDLASDDRYFGAEPPQPDAEMLQRIAQKEVSRRVEAREHEGRIVLSAHEEQPAVAATAALATVAAVADAPTEAVAAQSPAAEAVEDTTTAYAAPEVDTSADMASLVSAAVSNSVEADAVATDLHAADGEMADADTAEDETQALTDEVDETSEEDEAIGWDGTEFGAEAMADEADATSAEAPFALSEELATDEEQEDVAAEFVEDAPETDIVPSLPDDEVEAFFNEASDDVSDAYEGEEAMEPVAAADIAQPATAAQASSIAEKLKRIRAVVSRHQENDEAPDYLEDEHADSDAVAEAPSLMETMTTPDEDESETSEDVMSSALRDLNDALRADDEAQEAQQSDAYEEEHLEDDSDDVSDILNRLDMADHAEVEEGIADEDEGSISDMLVDSLMSEDAMSEEDDVSDLDEDAPAENLFDGSDDDEANADWDGEDDAEAEMADDAASQLRTRVIKVKRVELEAAISSGALEEVEEEPDQSSLSDQAEAELARELAEVEAELDDGHAETLDMTTEDDAEDTLDDADLEDALEADLDDAEALEDAHDLDEELHSAARDMLPSIDDDQDSDISRLLAETNSQMGEQEGATRRDAFAHLRAAVAAKKADVEAGGTDLEEDGDGAYRDDLASVVKPRRPATSAGRTARPQSDGRPAPLKLVAEQRIDVDEMQPTGPVRPRRVASMEEATGVDAGSFAEFAADMGASKLPELLEAAAAYMSFVEGREQFSRPQLMTKVRQVEQQDFSREDSLRSFGKLLRDGKIEKIKGGRFQVSEQIGFRPDERAAG